MITKLQYLFIGCDDVIWGHYRYQFGMWIEICMIKQKIVFCIAGQITDGVYDKCEYVNREIR